MVKLKSRILLSVLFIILVLSTIGLLNYNRIVFEYYVWNLSSENISEREYYAEEIHKMGMVAVPFLAEKLDHVYVFESYYIIGNLEKLIGTGKNYPQEQSDKIEYWKKWWSKNKHKY